MCWRKIVGEMHARIQARKTKEVTRRKNALESAAMPSKLSDCQPGNDDVAELFIVEGDSALGTAKCAQFRIPGAAADPRQDTQRAEGIVEPDAQQQGMRRDHPGGRCGIRRRFRHRAVPLPQGHHHDRCRRGRRPYPHPAAHAVLPVHAPAHRARVRLRRRAAAASHRARRLAQGRVHLHVLR